MYLCELYLSRYEYLIYALTSIKTHIDILLVYLDFLPVFTYLFERSQSGRNRPRLLHHACNAENEREDDFLPMPNYTIRRSVRFVGKGKNFLEACLHGGWTRTSQFFSRPSRHHPRHGTVIFSPQVCAGHHAFANSFFSAFST